MTDASVATAKPPRWGFLRGIWVVALIALLYVRLGGVDEGGRTAFTIISVLSGLFLSTLWLLFLSRLPWSSRFKGLALAIALFIAVRATVRIKEFEGDIFPVLTWRWEPPKDTTLTALPEAPKTSTPVADAPKLVSYEPGPNGFAQWLGNRRDGKMEAGIVFKAEQWPPKENWRIPIGAGWSGLVVLGNKAITQEQRGPDELVSCYELATGKPLWSHKDGVRFSETMGGDGPRATPVIYQGLVYALGATGILNCLELETGALKWTRDTLKDAKQENLMWGKSASPLIVDDLVIISLGKSMDKTLAAFNRMSGEPAWRSGDDESSYASPALGTLCGQKMIVSVNKDSVSGHDPKTGEMLWRNTFPGAPAKCADPVILDGDRVFIGVGYGVGCKMLKIEKASDGKFGAKELWKNIRFKPKFSNILIKDGFSYGLDEGVLVCLNLESGERLWKDGSYGHGQILLAGDTILVQAESGAVALVEASSKGFKELFKFPAMKAKTWNSPTIAGKTLLVRNAEEAVSYTLP